MDIALRSSRRPTRIPAWLRAIVGAAMLLCAMPGFALDGVVTHVSDGDTLWLKTAHGRRPIKLRLLGIDAPEICQSGGAQSRQALIALVQGRQVHVEAKGRDTNGRRLGLLSRDGDDIGARMVRDGQAWSYRYKGNPGPYVAEEREARAARRGLFAERSPTEPRVFRKQHGPCQ
jgi:endonuclease YncB( thermonuclease family)